MVEISESVFTGDYNPIPVLAAYQNGLGYADVGNIPKLEQALSAIQVSLNNPVFDLRHRKYEYVLSANLALLKGDVGGAEKHLENQSSLFGGWSHVFRLRARIAGMKGDTDQALWEYNLTANHISTRGYNVAAYPSFFAEHARTPYEIARMFDDRNGPGDREEAIKRYQEALDGWANVGADFKYVQMTEDRLAELLN